MLEGEQFVERKALCLHQLGGRAALHDTYIAQGSIKGGVRSNTAVYMSAMSKAVS